MNLSGASKRLQDLLVVDDDGQTRLAKALSLSKEWEESKHPRDAHGRFGSGGEVMSVTGREAKDFSDAELRRFASTDFVNGATHARGDKVYGITYNDGTQRVFRCENNKDADAISREYGRRFLGQTSKDGVRQVPPGTDLTGKTDETPIKPTGEAMKPQPQGQPTTGPTLDPEVMGRLKAEYDKAQKQYDKAVKELTKEDAKGGKLLFINRQMGKQVVDAVDEKFSTLTFPTYQGRTPAEIRATDRVQLRQETINLDVQNRFNELKQNLANARAEVAAPIVVAALREAGVPEGHEAYRLAATEGFGYVCTSRSGGGSDYISFDVRIHADYDGNRVLRYYPDNYAAGKHTDAVIAPTKEQIANLEALGAEQMHGNLYAENSERAMFMALGGAFLSDEMVFRASADAIGSATPESIANAVGVDKFNSLNFDNQRLLAENQKTKDELYKAVEEEGRINAMSRQAKIDLTFNTIGALRPLSENGALNIRSITTGLRPTARNPRNENIANTAAAIQQAQQKLPSDWIQRANGRNQSGITFKCTNGGGSGKYLDYTSGGPTIRLRSTYGNSNFPRIATHEITHSCQGACQDIGVAERAFLRDRATGKEVAVGAGGKGDPDNFRDKYTGRNPYTDGFTEVMTTGMEQMIAQSFGGDTDFQNFVTGTLLMAGRGKA